jgi:hypothetical protein
MKHQPVILFSAFVLLSFLANAQTAPQKGYYAIHNNAQKLASNNGHTSNVNNGSNSKALTPAAPKGFYAIKDNSIKLNMAREYDAVVPTQSAAKNGATTRPTKGYYAIGSNYNRLSN